MKRTLSWIVAVAASTAVVGAAHAADIPRPPPPVVKAPAYVAPPPFSWAGFYIGANFGYGWSSGSGTVTNVGIAPFGASGPTSGSGDGIFGGAQIGYNWQSGAFVYGLETDFQASDGNGSYTGVAGGRTFSGRARNEWFGTIRGRVGYAVDNWLFYATGGGAYTENRINGTTTFGGVTTPYAVSATGWTWTVGAGIEAAVARNWSIKGEYLYLATPDSVPVPPGTRVSGSTDTHLIRLGVNYHF